MGADHASCDRLIRRLVHHGIRPGGLIVFHEDVARAGGDVVEIDTYLLATDGQRVREHGRDGWLVPKRVLSSLPGPFALIEAEGGQARRATEHRRLHVPR